MYQYSFEHVNDLPEKAMILTREVGFRTIQVSTWVVYAVTTSLDFSWDIILFGTTLYYLVKAKTSVVSFVCDLLKLTENPPKWERQAIFGVFVLKKTQTNHNNYTFLSFPVKFWRSSIPPSCRR